MSTTSGKTSSQSGGLFPQTHWSVILAAGVAGAFNREKALEEFCQSYRSPVCCYLRAKGYQPADAEDLTQEFFGWVLQKDALAGLTREGSKFRSYLLTVLRNFQANQWRAETAAKRGGGAKHYSIDADSEMRISEEMSVQTPAEVAFDREWARAVCARVLGRLREEYLVAGNERLFERLQGSLTGAAETPAHAEAATDLGMTESAVRQALYRMRQRYRELLRMEIAAGGTRADEIKEEIRYLMAVIGSE
jgi:RNA polymerase sigma factor (sigma-70 family)